jgi:hypothetical protein
LKRHPYSLERLVRHWFASVFAMLTIRAGNYGVHLLGIVRLFIVEFYQPGSVEARVKRV